jgi:hypothetical protein
MRNGGRTHLCGAVAFCKIGAAVNAFDLPPWMNVAVGVRAQRSG